ncbi:Os07g0609550, partial [Oryza sativa Japonica Group]
SRDHPLHAGFPGSTTRERARAKAGDGGGARGPPRHGDPPLPSAPRHGGVAATPATLLRWREEGPRSTVRASAARWSGSGTRPRQPLESVIEVSHIDAVLQRAAEEDLLLGGGDGADDDVLSAALWFQAHRYVTSQNEPHPLLASRI